MQRAVGKSVVVAAADERLLVERVRVAGKSRTPTDVLQVGSVLEEVAAAEDETAAAMSAPLASNPGRP